MFKVVPDYQAFPAHCKSCGNAGRLPIVDMGWSEEFYGAVYLCMTCAEELGSITGFSPDSKLQDLRNTIRALETQNEELHARLALNADVTELLQPLIRTLSDNIRQEYRERFNSELVSIRDQLTKEHEDELNRISADYNYQLGVANELAISNQQLIEAYQNGAAGIISEQGRDDFDDSEGEDGTAEFSSDEGSVGVQSGEPDSKPKSKLPI